jgi:hypothetical protein
MSREQLSYLLRLVKGGMLERATAMIEQELAKPEQEPVAVWELTEDGWDTIADAAWMETLPVGTKLYTAPPRKPWVGLTDEEIKGILDCGRGNLIDIKKAEQTLKDKNT